MIDMISDGQISKKVILVDGILTTYYILSAKSDLPDMVFLHGWGGESQTWSAIYSQIKGKYNSYFLDLPGFGKSEKPQSPYDLDEYARFIYDWMLKLGLKKVILVGHSFGGSIAALVAGKYPGQVDKLILVDSAGIRRNSILKEFKKTVARIVKPIFTPHFMQPLRKIVYLQMGAEDYLTLPAMQDIYKKIITQDITLKLHLIKQPTFIIWGGDDKVTPINDAEVFHKSICNSKLKVIPHAGHLVFLDQPQAFIEALTNI
jgi:pimeloyl-ACP methyl ester carboxylesterase